ncbi:A24 family peptidase [Candidatus Woesearchaeota archaeon]|nr:A24 family peptidase [Candidatus Woesearchaeota archaeon]
MIEFVIAVIALLVASWSDIKTREVPDWLSYALIFIGFGLRAILSIFHEDPSYILYGAYGFIVFLGIGLLLYYSGQWGGGDSKLIWGIGALIGLKLELSMQFMILFLINLIIIGAVYGFVWSITLSIKHRKQFIKEYTNISNKLKGLRKIVLISSIGLFILFLLLINNTLLSLPLLLVAVFALLFFYVFVFAKAVENSCMLKLYPISKLTEGDWIAKDVIVKGKKICGPKDLGITKEQIATLKKLKIKKVLVKEGIPFVPSFLIAFIFTWVVGNWFLFF